MRECATVETIRNSFAIYVLLSQTRNHLGDIDKRTFRPRIHNHQEPIVFTQTFASNFARLIVRLFHDIVNSIFKLGHVGIGRFVFENTQMNIINHLFGFQFLVRNDFDNIGGCFLV
ncbi:hypothetical protein EBX93_16940 [bacterium]|nr:hypothetical protein [bacterium]